MDSVALGFEIIRIQEKHRFKLHRRSIRDASNPLEIPEETFIELFRLTKEAFLFIFDEIKDGYKRNYRSTAIQPIIKLSATLRFLAEGSYQRGIGQDFLICMAQPTVSQTISETVNILENVLCPKVLKFAMTREERRKSQIEFFKRSGFPGVIGCVDGTHIKIVRPSENEHLFYDRSGDHSINAMIVCDYDTKILSVNGNYAGASHDSLVWERSEDRNFMETCRREGETKMWLLGDSGYPLEPWLMTPYASRYAPEGSPEAKFNTIHSKTRVTVERTFGILKGRWRCLIAARELHYTPQKARQFLNVCCALHNVCVQFKIEFTDPLVVEEDLLEEPAIQNSSTLLREAQKIRDTIKNYII